VKNEAQLAGCIVEGAVFPEPVKVVITQLVGTKLKIGGQGIRTKQYIERLIDDHQFADLTVSPSEPSFVGEWKSSISPAVKLRES